MSASSTAPVPGCGSPIEITSVSEWNSILRHAYANNQTVIADFHAEWCAPCHQIAPVYSNLASQKPFTYFLRVDVDGPSTKAIAAKYTISAMPTFVVIKRPPGGDAQGKGVVVDTLKGADPHGLARIANTYGSSAYAPSSSLASAEAEQQKNIGNELFKGKDYGGAVDAYSKAIELSPQSGVLYANRALTYLRWIQSASEGADSIESRNKKRPKLLMDAQRATELEERWGKAWVRMAEALMESISEESMKSVKVESRAEGRKQGLQGVEEVLENAIGLSEGKVKSEAQKMLDDVKKEL